MYPYFDAHCDTLLALMHRSGELRENDCHIDLNRLAEYKPAAQFFAIFLDMGEEMRLKCKTEDEFIRNVRLGGIEPDASILSKHREAVEFFNRQMTENGDTVMPCYNLSDLERAEKNKLTAAFLSVEGAEQLNGITPEKMYDEGVRMITITWNYANKFGGSCISGGGLTPKGRELVRRLNELGIIVDVSHGSDELFYDVAEVSSKPFVASHSNSRAVYDHRRNITDDQFRELIKCGGVTGINLFSDFLAGGKCTIADVVRHIEHFCSLGGEKNIALGGDLDGCESLPEGIGGVQDVYKIAQELDRLGYADNLINDIFYGNLRRVIGKVIG